MRPLRDLVLYCDRPSNTVNELANRLNSRRLYATARRKLRATSGALVINYGTSAVPSWPVADKAILVNDPSKVKAAISKVTSYERFKEAGVPIVEFTTELAVATGWKVEGHNVLSRRDGLSSGSGISFSKDTGDVKQSDFYVKYFPKTHEYRVHVFRKPGGGDNGNAEWGTGLDSFSVIDITQKKRTTPGDGNEGMEANRTLHQRVVRSLENGWVHAHENLHLPGDFKDKISEAAIKAVVALGLDFGAVDIIAQFGTKNTGKLYGFAVLEVNTAPGLGNQVTLEAYCNAIKGLYEETKEARAVTVRKRVRKAPRRRVRRLVSVTFISRKGNKITRMRERWVRE
jgi:hypothetical protein